MPDLCSGFWISKRKFFYTFWFPDSFIQCASIVNRNKKFRKLDANIIDLIIYVVVLVCRRNGRLKINQDKNIDNEVYIKSASST